MYNNGDLGRALIHFGVTATLLLSFAEAPFQHAHASDPSHEHAQGLTHTHWKAHQGNPAWQAEDHDSDARTIDWLAGDGRTSARFVAELPDSIAGVVFIVEAVRPPELIPHNHDPPQWPVPHLRGPPA
jgi:hypothetical protein